MPSSGLTIRNTIVQFLVSQLISIELDFCANSKSVNTASHHSLITYFTLYYIVILFTILSCL